VRDKNRHSRRMRRMKICVVEKALNENKRYRNIREMKISIFIGSSSSIVLQY
jgi:hypothetical protein